MAQSDRSWRKCKKNSDCHKGEYCDKDYFDDEYYGVCLKKN